MESEQIVCREWKQNINEKQAHSCHKTTERQMVGTRHCRRQRADSMAPNQRDRWKSVREGRASDPLQTLAEEDTPPAENLFFENLRHWNSRLENMKYRKSWGRGIQFKTKRNSTYWLPLAPPTLSSKKADNTIGLYLSPYAGEWRILLWNAWIHWEKSPRRIYLSCIEISWTSPLNTREPVNCWQIPSTQWSFQPATWFLTLNIKLESKKHWTLEEIL